MSLIPAERIEKSILLIRDQKVMMDFQLAEMYGVPVKRLNEQVRRNIDRFPMDFMFQLSADEAESLRSQFATSNSDTPATGTHRCGCMHCRLSGLHSVSINLSYRITLELLITESEIVPINVGDLERVP